jgi:predicted O-methyltransferase YrrM
VLTRVASFSNFWGLGASDRRLAESHAREAAERSEGMMAAEDYRALAAVALYSRPHRIFEIGTYLGVTSDFFLDLLPDCHVVSIAYVTGRLAKLRGGRFNNSELSRRKVGSRVRARHRARYTQLYGDSHSLNPTTLKRIGPYDLVLIDGDHTAEGVRQDTELARKILVPDGVICWHDANPKQAYIGVRRYLEEDLALSAIATRDTYIGGIAAWSTDIQRRL